MRAADKVTGFCCLMVFGATAACADAFECAEPVAVQADDERLRFVAIGDTGTGDAAQQQVANAVTAKCATRGCDFVLLLGDNFYDHGVVSVTDPQWQSKFEKPYAAIDVPWFAVLGNHDYGGGHLGLDQSRAQAQLDYAKTGSRFRMPGRCYALVSSVATLVGLDTTALVWESPGAFHNQGGYVARTLSNQTTGWRIAFGHHPYRSNGTHGNAGAYGGVHWPPAASGASFQNFFESYLCPKLDLYISGHDHSLGLLPGNNHCAAMMLVSGAGARLTSLPGTQEMLYGKAALGFAYLDGTPTTLQIEMVTADDTTAFVFSRK